MSWKPGRSQWEVPSLQPLLIPARAAWVVGSQASGAASPVIEQETRTEEAVDLPWQVVVHNDPVNLMSYVTMVFQKVFGFTHEKAEQHMREVHEQGRSIVWSGLRERAELYVQQLHGYLLLATLERVS
ncbi:MAG: ATP-dependent Clp protease adapter ClpS [Chthoniobacterales bacterium]